MSGAPVQAVAAKRSWLSHATEPHILFPAIAVLVLAVIWGTTLNLIRVERLPAEHAAAASSRELAETYEAQVVRALREIDQTLKLVKYVYELRGKELALQELKARALLPPDLLFVVSIVDSKGDVVASTHPPAWPRTRRSSDTPYSIWPAVARIARRTRHIRRTACVAPASIYAACLSWAFLLNVLYRPAGR